MSAKKFAFARMVDDVDLPPLPDFGKLYEQALKTREGKRAMFEKALNAALENLMSWERMARAEGFEVRAITDAAMGAPVPHYDDGKITFVQSYGVSVI